MLKYRLCGVDIDGTLKEFGHCLTQKEARRYRAKMKIQGVVLSIQNITNGKLVK